MTADRLLAYSWPASLVGEALELLAQKSSLLTTTAEIPLPPENIRAIMSTESEAGYAATGRWIEAVASHLNLEVEPVEAYYPEAEDLVTHAAPALVRLPRATLDDEPRFLALVKGRRRSISLVTHDGSIRRVRPGEIRRAICEPLESQLVEPIDRLLSEAGIPVERMDKVRGAILREQLSQVQIGNCWLLRFAPNAQMWQQLRRARLPRDMVAFLSIHLVQYLSLIHI